MKEHFDYLKPDVFDFCTHSAEGESCYIDCATDDICTGAMDEI